MACAEWNEDINEHTRNERMGTVSVVFANSIFFSRSILAIQHPTTVKRHRSLILLNGKKERIKK